MLAGACVLAVTEGLLAAVDQRLPPFAGVPEAQNSLSSARHFDVFMRLEKSAQKKIKELRCCFCSKAVAVIFVGKIRCTYRGLNSSERRGGGGGGREAQPTSGSIQSRILGNGLYLTNFRK